MATTETHNTQNLRWSCNHNLIFAGDIYFGCSNEIRSQLLLNYHTVMLFHISPWCEEDGNEKNIISFAAS